MSEIEVRAPITGWRRWGAYLALTVVFALVCGLLSLWQWARRGEALARIERVERNYDAEPRPLSEILPTLNSWQAEDEWVPVRLSGEYLGEHQALVRNRVREGRPGFLQLVPFRMVDGNILAIDRGWLSIGLSQDEPDTVPEPPRGQVELIVRLRPGEPELRGWVAPPGQMLSIHLPTMIERLGTGYTGAYGVLLSETPAPVDKPLSALRPSMDEGPHLSYALQWIAFGVLAFVGLIWAWRRERRIAALPAQEQAAARAPRRAHKDAEVEDAILDELT